MQYFLHYYLDTWSNIEFDWNSNNYIAVSVWLEHLKCLSLSSPALRVFTIWIMASWKAMQLLSLPIIWNPDPVDKFLCCSIWQGYLWPENKPVLKIYQDSIFFVFCISHIWSEDCEQVKDIHELSCDCMVRCFTIRCSGLSLRCCARRKPMVRCLATLWRGFGPHHCAWRERIVCGFATRSRDTLLALWKLGYPWTDSRYP